MVMPDAGPGHTCALCSNSMRKPTTLSRFRACYVCRRRMFRRFPIRLQIFGKNGILLSYPWSEATDKLYHYVRVALLDLSKVFDLINNNMLLVKLKQYDLPPHIRRWIATFLLDRTQHVKIRNNFSPQGTLKEEYHRGHC